MIEIAFITAMIVYFFHACTWEGMIFAVVDKALKNQPDYLRKPLYDCPICMSVWWGPVIISIGILARAWVITNLWQLILTVFLSAAINIFFAYIISNLKNKSSRMAKIKRCDACSRNKKSENDQ